MCNEKPLKAYRTVSVGSLLISCDNGKDCVMSSLTSYESAIRLMLAALEQPETTSVMLTLNKLTQRKVAKVANG